MKMTPIVPDSDFDVSTPEWSRLRASLWQSRAAAPEGPHSSSRGSASFSAVAARLIARVDVDADMGADMGVHMGETREDIADGFGANGKGQHGKTPINPNDSAISKCDYSIHSLHSDRSDFENDVTDNILGKAH